MSNKNTKELILEKALNLFSQKGFQAVSTREIAEAVGVQKGALYNHFKNKQDIFDQIIYYVNEHIHQMNKTLEFPSLNGENPMLLEGNMSREDHINLSCQMFKTYVSDTTIMKFRRMYMIEQYTSVEIQRKYHQYFIDTMIDQITNMNQKLMDAGIYKKSNPRTLAILYFSPTFLLMNRYDGEDMTLDEVVTMLKECIEHFLDEVLIIK